MKASAVQNAIVIPSISGWQTNIRKINSLNAPRSLSGSGKLPEVTLSGITGLIKWIL